LYVATVSALPPSPSTVVTSGWIPPSTTVGASSTYSLKLPKE